MSCFSLQKLYKESKRTSDLDVGALTSKKRGNDSDNEGDESDGEMNGMSGSNDSSPRKAVKRGASDTSPEASPAKKVFKKWLIDRLSNIPEMLPTLPVMC